MGCLPIRGRERPSCGVSLSPDRAVGDRCLPVCATQTGVRVLRVGGEGVGGGLVGVAGDLLGAAGEG